jgi:hypothetical protein
LPTLRVRVAIAATDRYACTGHTNGGNALGANNAMLMRQVVEAEVTAGLKRELGRRRSSTKFAAVYGPHNVNHLLLRWTKVLG